MERVIKTFRKFDATAKEASRTFNEVKKALEKEYGNSRAFEKQYGEAKNIFDETMAKAKQEALQEINTVFAEVTEKVKNFVQQPAPADFVSTLEALKTMGNHVTQQEAEVFFGKYKNNYMAARSISNYLHDLKGYLLPIPAYDRIMEELAADKENATRFVIDYKANSYTTALFTTEKNNPWEAEAEMFKQFLNGDVSVIAEPIETK